MTTTVLIDGGEHKLDAIVAEAEGSDKPAWIALAQQIRTLGDQLIHDMRFYREEQALIEMVEQAHRALSDFRQANGRLQPEAHPDMGTTIGYARVSEPPIARSADEPSAPRSSGKHEWVAPNVPGRMTAIRLWAADNRDLLDSLRIPPPKELGTLSIRLTDAYDDALKPGRARRS